MEENKLLKKYDVILVGGGIANISLAINLINTNLSVLLIEKGQDLVNRSCPKIKTDKCVGCNPCRITTGFGGAGTFSDCKLTYSPEIGGNLIDYIGKKNFEKYLKKADELFTNFGGKQEYFDNEEFSNKLQYECSKYSMKLIKGKVRHLGTDGSYQVMSNIYKALIESKNITILCNTSVIDIDFKNNCVLVNAKNSGINAMNFSYDKLSIAVGRYGSEWLKNLCEKNSIKLINNSVDIGVRIECPRSVTDPITNNMYEFKIVNYSSSGNAVRTFCVNPGGFVTQESYDNKDGSKLNCVNGHSNANNESLTSNFALLVTSHFTEPFNQPIAYAKSIASMCNMLADGKPMVQRLIDLKNKKRTTSSRLKRLCYEPTLKEAEPGDLRYVLPSNILDSIIETIENLDNVMPGINGDSTILFAPEIKMYSSKIDLNNLLQTANLENVYFLGDSSGVTHGIIQSAMSGIYVSDLIKNK